MSEFVIQWPSDASLESYKGSSLREPKIKFIGLVNKFKCYFIPNDNNKIYVSGSGRA